MVDGSIDSCCFGNETLVERPLLVVERTPVEENVGVL